MMRLNAKPGTLRCRLPEGSRDGVGGGHADAGRGIILGEFTKASILNAEIGIAHLEAFAFHVSVVMLTKNRDYKADHSDPEWIRKLCSMNHRAQILGPSIHSDETS